MSPEHAQLVGRVRSSAAVLAAAVRTVPAGKETQTPVPGEWSVQETLVHARPVRRANLQEPEPLNEVLDMIVAEHEQIARLLRALPDADWQRAGRHPERGAMSIELLARWAADHAEDHAAQIAATAGRLWGPTEP
ncbi:MAG: DinB family protein [Candidatus Rokubacteria bacterium]|nr:DinB family protein [Candidatus Rokubacteria bacterium]